MTTSAGAGAVQVTAAATMIAFHIHQPPISLAPLLSTFGLNLGLPGIRFRRAKLKCETMPRERDFERWINCTFLLCTLLWVLYGCGWWSKLLAGPA